MLFLFFFKKKDVLGVHSYQTIEASLSDKQKPHQRYSYKKLKVSEVIPIEICTLLSQVLYTFLDPYHLFFVLTVT
jgi:hypothetical protein